MFLVCKISSDLDHVIEVRERPTHGEANRLAVDWSDAGFCSRIIPNGDIGEFTYYWNQICEKRELGYVREYGRIPNGSAIRRRHDTYGLRVVDGGLSDNSVDGGYSLRRDSLFANGKIPSGFDQTIPNADQAIPIRSEDSQEAWAKPTQNSAAITGRDEYRSTKAQTKHLTLLTSS